MQSLANWHSIVGHDYVEASRVIVPVNVLDVFKDEEEARSDSFMSRRGFECCHGCFSRSSISFNPCGF